MIANESLTKELLWKKLDAETSIEKIELLLNEGRHLLAEKDLYILFIGLVHKFFKEGIILYAKLINRPPAEVAMQAAKDLVIQGKKNYVCFCIDVDIKLLHHQYEGGQTLLHLAVIHGQIEIVELLLKLGADVNVKNADGKSPLNIAELQSTSLSIIILQHVVSCDSQKANSAIRGQFLIDSSRIKDLEQKMEQMKEFEKKILDENSKMKLDIINLKFNLDKLKQTTLPSQVEDAEIGKKTEHAQISSGKVNVNNVISSSLPKLVTPDFFLMSSFASSLPSVNSSSSSFFPPPKVISEDKVSLLISKDIDAKEVSVLLKYATEGHLKEVEKLLIKTPKLAQAQGDITDLSDRVFENVTVLQYAVWALDDEMWDLILKYLDETQARLQLEALKDKKYIIDKHGAYFSFDSLIAKYEEFLSQQRSWTEHIQENKWCRELKVYQQGLPAWVVYAFCEKVRWDRDNAWKSKEFERKVDRDYCASHLNIFFKGAQPLSRGREKEPRMMSYEHIGWNGPPGRKWKQYEVWDRKGYGIHELEHDCYNFKQLKSRQVEKLEALKVRLQTAQNVVLKP